MLNWEPVSGFEPLACLAGASQAQTIIVASSERHTPGTGHDH